MRVKTGSKSPDKYNGSLELNIVSRSVDIGFVKLGENNAFSGPAPLNVKPFGKDQLYTFFFEAKDIRNVMCFFFYLLYAFLLLQQKFTAVSCVCVRSSKIKGIMLLPSGDGAPLYIDYVEVDAIRLSGKTYYR